MTRQPTSDGRFGGDASGSSALVLASAAERETRRAIADHVGVSPLHSNVLAVTYDRGAQEWLTDWRRRVGGRAAGMAVVSPAEFSRSAAASAPSTHELPGRTTVEAIDDPTDLSALGDRMRAHLDRWRRENRQCLVVFDGVTELLAHVSRRTAFGFLHLLVHETRDADAVGWFHADPHAHSPATIGTVADLFGAVVQPHGDDWRTTREYLPPAGQRPTGNGTTNGHGSLPDDWQAFDED